MIQRRDELVVGIHESAFCRTRNLCLNASDFDVVDINIICLASGVEMADCHVNLLTRVC